MRTWLRNRRSSVIVLAALCVAAISVTTAAATVIRADTPTTFYACEQADTGKLYDVTQGTTPTCRTNDTVVSWNQQGPQGPQGPTGAQGPTGVSGYEEITTVATVTGGDSTVRAYCSAGKVPLGGGYVFGGGDLVDVPRSFPAGGNSWQVNFYDPNPDTQGVTVFVYVICANAN